MLSGELGLTPELYAATGGWFNHGAKIMALLEQHRPMVVVELGSWLGQSAISMARVVRRWGGLIYCVDTWTGELSQNGSDGKNPIMIGSCARNLVEAGVGASVRLIPAPTRYAAALWLQVNVDALYIDASHDYASVCDDLSNWIPLVRPGGLVMGDDYGNPIFPGLTQAWDEFEASDERLGPRTLTRYQSDPPHPHGIQLIYGTV